MIDLKKLKTLIREYLTGAHLDYYSQVPDEDEESIFHIFTFSIPENTEFELDGLYNLEEDLNDLYHENGRFVTIVPVLVKKPRFIVVIPLEVK